MFFVVCYSIVLPVLPILRSSEASNSNFCQFNKFLCGLCFCTQCWSSLLLFTVASLLHSVLFSLSVDLALQWRLRPGLHHTYRRRRRVMGPLNPGCFDCFPLACPVLASFSTSFSTYAFPFQILCLNGTRFLPNWHKFLWLIAATYIAAKFPGATMFVDGWLLFDLGPLQGLGRGSLEKSGRCCFAVFQHEISYGNLMNISKIVGVF